MKFLGKYLLLLSLLIISHGLVLAESTEVMARQTPLAVTKSSGGTWKADWEGVTGRTYLMEWSTDLLNWNYLPMTESGAGTKSYGFASTAENGFFRLFYSDETPDIGKTANWQPPLLAVNGEWTVLARQYDATPAAGVKLAFHLWEQGAAKAQTIPISYGFTLADGTCAFDPQAITAGNRVEVRMSANPQQRVYLPWSQGSVTADANISPGGIGLALTGFIQGAGTGKVPDFRKKADVGPLFAGANAPVYRLEDYLTMDYSKENYSKSEFPSAFHEVTEKTTQAGVETNVFIDTPLDQSNWKKPYPLGGAAKRNGSLLDEGQEQYDAKFEAELDDPTKTISIQRNIIVNTLPQNVEDAWPIPDPVYPAIQVGFKDGVKHDWGRGALPYNVAECPFNENVFNGGGGGGGGASNAATPQGLIFERQLVLGPVPTHVPKSVMCGEPFYFRGDVLNEDPSSTDGKYKKIKLYAELPLGASGMQSYFSDPPPNGGGHRTVPTQIVWNATVTQQGGGAVIQASLNDGNASVSPSLETNSPVIWLTFSNQESWDEPIFGDFSVTVSAKLKVATGENPPNGEAGHTYQYSLFTLGSFTTQFQYANLERQAAELRGTTQDAPESDHFNGGQRSKTLEAERCVNITGQPGRDEDTLVDALTGRFIRSETDFSLMIPGSDLSLSVVRRIQDSIWTDAFGLHPNENPLLHFGPGWDSNLSGSIVKTSALMPDGKDWETDPELPRALHSSLSVRDYQGREYSFLHYTDGAGNASYFADPTMLPKRETHEMTLVPSAGDGFILSQPSLGLTHTYQKSAVDFRIANNRDTPTIGIINASGFTRFEYYRLASVTDRFGVTLNYSYGNDGSKLVPDSISVVGRPALQLRIQQNAGKILAFWDPSGIKHSYGYEPRNLAASGQTADTHLVLAHHLTGTSTSASYGYQYLVEPDPRPATMLLNTTNGQAYTIPTYHILPNSFTNGTGDNLVIRHRRSDVRRAWSVSANSYYETAGDPMIVDYITLPNQRVVDFDLQHILKYGRPAKPADANGPAVPAIPDELSIVTLVTTMHGDHWRYGYGTPELHRWLLLPDDAKFLPPASALSFTSMTRSCTELADSAMVFQYDTAAGGALKQSEDSAGRNIVATYNEAFSQSSTYYQPPQITQSVAINSRFNLPTTFTDRLNRTSTYDYNDSPGNHSHKRVASITDHSGRSVIPTYGAHSRMEDVRLEKAGNVLARSAYAYDATLPGVVTQITRKAISGAGDPAWVTDLVTDIQPDAYGFPEKIGNAAANLHTTYSRSASGRLLESSTPKGGKISYQYNADGLLKTSHLEDGASRSYTHDLARRTVLWENERGHATGVAYDSLGRVSKVVRDMNGNLDFDSQTGLSGIDAGTDWVASTLFLDAAHEIRITDPLNHTRIIRYDALERTVKDIAPGNQRNPGELPVETQDRVTSYDYDLLQSPDGPVKVTDPLGFETLYQYDNFARLEKILREYSDDQASQSLYSGTVYGYHAVTGLLDHVTTIRTPLDAEGDAAEANAQLQQINARIIRDDLDRAQTSIVAEGTDKELRSQYRHTSTGLLYKREIRDSLANGNNPEHWSNWEITFDALGRPQKKTLPATKDALTDQVSSPFTDFIYDTYGELTQTGDSYGNLTSYGYDVSGRLSFRKDPAVKDAKSGQILHPIHVYGYDASGLLVHSVDPLGYAWDYERDAVGRILKSTGPIASPAASPNRRRPVWSQFYDAAGNLKKVTNPEGHVKNHAYYPDRNIASTTTPVTFTDPSGVDSIVNVLEQYGRDELGRITRVTDGKGQATAFAYDGLSRLLTTTRDPDDARAKTTSTAYDALLPISKLDAKGQTKEFLYNNQFRLSQINVTGAPAESLDFLYDLLGNVTNISPVNAPGDPSMGNPAIARSHDALGQLLQETSNGITTSYGYDLLGRLSKLTNDAESRNLSIQHDAAGRPSRTVELSGGATLTTTFGHDLASNLIHEEMPNGCELKNTFDPAGRITNRSIRNPNGPLCQNAYQYDLLSNVTRIEETSGQLNLPQRVITNRYNERRQLVEETSTRSSGSLGSNVHTQHQLHRYDAAENRSSTHTQSLINGAATASHSRAFVYGDPANGYPSNQLHQLTETPGAGNPVTTTYTYDANGNRSTKTFGNATDTYSYDAFNRLTQFTQQTATPSENGTWHYRYDPLTRRIARKATGQNPYLYAFNGTSPAFEWQGSLPSTTLIKHTGGGVSGRLYTQDANGITSHPYHNIRGDITAEFSSSGTMTLHRSYNADGLPEDQSGNPSSSYGPNGKWQEPGGLSNEGHRYRDRHTATFLTPDPAGFIDGPNTYNYARHNPWSTWDPNGLAGYSVPGGTTDIGYTGPPATVTGITTDPDGGLPNLPTDLGSGYHHPMLNDLLPDFEQYSAWVEDGALDPYIGPASPHNLSIAISNMDSRELQQLLSSGGYSPEEKSRIEQQSQSASDAEHDWEIIAGTGYGLSNIGTEYLAAKAATTALSIVISGVVRAGTTVKFGTKLPNTTRLFRAVEADELSDVMRYGDYNIHSNSTFKRFAFDESSLDDFIKANPTRFYTKTYIDAPTENLWKMYRHADPGGVGKSIGIDVYENPTFYNWFDKVNIIEK